MPEEPIDWNSVEPETGLFLGPSFCWQFSSHTANCMRWLEREWRGPELAAIPQALQTQWGNSNWQHPGQVSAFSLPKWVNLTFSSVVARFRSSI